MPTLSPLLMKVSTLISEYLLLWDLNIARDEGAIGNIEVTTYDASGEDVTEDMTKRPVLQPNIPGSITFNLDFCCFLLTI